jgi:BirA family biotin operon repressor/biotin-[acetyl-CoA-carboxylase] ligase
MSRVNRWLDDGFAPIRQSWLNHAYGLGEAIGVELARERLEGRFKDLDENGTLILELPDGSVRNVAAGDVYRIG